MQIFRKYNKQLIFLPHCNSTESEIERCDGRKTNKTERKRNLCKTKSEETSFNYSQHAN